MTQLNMKNFFYSQNIVQSQNDVHPILYSEHTKSKLNLVPVE